MKRNLLFSLLCLMIFLIVLPITAQDADESTDWQNRVYYEIFVRSFNDSDGDGIGDFQGIIDKLDYLNDGDPTTTDDLGITGIWLMPINPSPSYHGYDVTDYYAVNPDYGTMDDFEALLDAAHERGITVIIDLVINHTSSQHPWFLESEAGTGTYDDWYIWEDENPGYAGPWGAQAWHESPDGRFYYGVFQSEMPDLNYRNPAVIDEMFNVIDFWLGDVGVDGFRVDAAKHLIEDGQLQENTPETRDILAIFNTYIKRVNPDALMVGEIFNGPEFRIAPYLEAGSFDMAFEFGLAGDIIGAANRQNKRDLFRRQGTVLDAYPDGHFASFLTNHDQPRVMSALVDNVNANKTAASLLLTGPGVPFLYYGEEIGMVGNKPDERIRTPMHWTDDPVTAGFTTADEPWQPIQENVDVANVALETDDPDSLLNHYRMLIHTRNAHPALSVGDMTLVNTSSRYIHGFLRYTDDEILLVMINLSDEPVADVEIDLKEGPLTTISDAEWIMGEGDFTLPVVNADGGIADTIPLAELAPFTTYIVKLIP